MNQKQAVMAVFFFLIISALPWAEETQPQPKKMRVMSTESVKGLSDTTNDLPFKRLFTSTKQRKILDDWRQHGGLNHSQISGSNEAVSNEPLIDNTSQPLKLSGILLRADGKNAVWLNGSLEKSADGNYAQVIRGNRQQSATVKVPLRPNDPGAILKPGQVWVPDDQRVEESYQIPQPKAALDIQSTQSSGEATSASNNAPSSSANASEMSANVEPKASAKSKP